MNPTPPLPQQVAPATPVTLHASAVSLKGRALLIIGPSGSGKSSLALDLMALGAALVADDRTEILPQAEGPPLAAAPAPIRGMIEARFIGLLAAEAAPPARVVAVVDLSRTETERLPPPRSISIGGADLPLIHKAETPHFAAGLIQYLKGGAYIS